MFDMGKVTHTQAFNIFVHLGREKCWLNGESPVKTVLKVKQDLREVINFQLDVRQISSSKPPCMLLESHGVELNHVPENPCPVYSWTKIAHSTVCVVIATTTSSSNLIFRGRNSISLTNEYTSAIALTTLTMFSSVSHCVFTAWNFGWKGQLIHKCIRWIPCTQQLISSMRHWHRDGSEK